MVWHAVHCRSKVAVDEDIANIYDQWMAEVFQILITKSDFDQTRYNAFAQYCRSVIETERDLISNPSYQGPFVPKRDPSQREADELCFCLSTGQTLTRATWPRSSSACTASMLASMHPPTRDTVC